MTIQLTALTLEALLNGLDAKVRENGGYESVGSWALRDAAAQLGDDLPLAEPLETDLT